MNNFFRDLLIIVLSTSAAFALQAMEEKEQVNNESFKERFADYLRQTKLTLCDCEDLAHLINLKRQEISACESEAVATLPQKGAQNREINAVGAKRKRGTLGIRRQPSSGGPRPQRPAQVRCETQELITQPLIKKPKNGHAPGKENDRNQINIERGQESAYGSEMVQNAGSDRRQDLIRFNENRLNVLTDSQLPPTQLDDLANTGLAAESSVSSPQEDSSDDEDDGLPSSPFDTPEDLTNLLL